MIISVKPYAPLVVVFAHLAGNSYFFFFLLSVYCFSPTWRVLMKLFLVHVVADRYYTTWSIWISFISSQIKFDKSFYEYDFQSIAVSNYEFGFPNSAPACLAVSPSFQAPLQNTQHKHTAMFHHNQAIKLSRQSCPLSIVMSLNPCHAIIRKFHHFVIL